MTSEIPEQITVGELTTHLIRLWGANRLGNPDLRKPTKVHRPQAKGPLRNQPVTYALFGVGPDTVRRWLRGKPEQTSAIPAAHLRQLFRPEEQTVTRERSQKRERAEDALDAYSSRKVPTARPRSRQEEAWWDKGWYLPHHVTVIALEPVDGNGKPIWRQVIVTKAGSVGDEKIALGRFVKRVLLPTYWHAQVVALRLLEKVGAGQNVVVEHAKGAVVDRTWSTKARTPDIDKIAAAVLVTWPSKSNVSPLGKGVFLRTCSSHSSLGPAVIPSSS